ncbi:superfamily II DNA helicase RecQ [Bartonella callosciuri]|uniref:Superfamily II DNA helicase RecQ n=1 Tax=Bartonella callosciuri TaxID=686223 RepID=A0A840NKX3_9HYPH|nr:hypothetical protein [Bartonella callosciuri]MBB5073276.1 superfamily II DNA helicase RecQ [Bartonella callosciuri]
MNSKSHTTKHVEQDNPSFFVVEQKERMDTPTEVTMSDIAKKLRSVYAQMQRKHSSRPLTLQSSVEESFKSYLDDISRAILVEHYIRCQKEKKLFEYLEQIKMLVQSLHSEKKSLEEAMVTQRMSRMSYSKTSNSVVQKLAYMACEKNQERSSLQEVPNFSGQSSITSSQKNVKNILQQENKSALSSDAMKSSSKKAEEFVGYHAAKERCSDVQEPDHCIENDHSLSLNAKSQETFFFLRSSVKKFLRYLLIIVFIAMITLCFMAF